MDADRFRAESITPVAGSCRSWSETILRHLGRGSKQNLVKSVCPTNGPRQRMVLFWQKLGFKMQGSGEIFKHDNRAYRNFSC